MSLTKTTLSADISAEALVLAVASASGAVVGQPFKIGDEYVRQIQAIDGTTITALGRGAYGTKAVAHGATEPVTFCGSSPSDFPGPQPQTSSDPLFSQPAMVYLDGDGAIPVPTRDTNVFVTKTSAAALTLANPSAGSDGVRLRIYGLTDFAHVVTLATAAPDGTSGGSTTLTSPAFAGCYIELIANKGIWILSSGATNAGPWVIT
jgi:hypothetical protein